MPNKPIKDFEIMNDLVRSIVHETEPYGVPKKLGNSTRKPGTAIKKTFVIRNPEDRVDAVLNLLFGDELPQLKRKQGGQSFGENDVVCLVELILENPSKTKEEILEIAVGLVQVRVSDAEDYNVKRRLAGAPWKEAKRRVEQIKNSGKSPDDIDFDEAQDFGFDCDEEQLEFLLPWLQKYRVQLINFLNKI